MAASALSHFIFRPLSQSGQPVNGLIYHIVLWTGGPLPASTPLEMKKALSLWKRKNGSH
jgi:hypothetical protein